MMLHCNICVQPLLQPLSLIPGDSGAATMASGPKFRGMACTKCGHVYHVDCLRNRLTNGQVWTPGKCPAAGCETRLAVPGLDVFRVNIQEADKRITSSDVFQQREKKLLEEKLECLQTRWKLSRKEAGDHRDLVTQQNIYISQLKYELEQSRNRENQLREEIRLRKAQEEYERRVQQVQRSAFVVNPNAALRNSVPMQRPSLNFPPTASLPRDMYSEFQLCGTNRPPPGFESVSQEQRPIASAPGPAPSGQNWNGALGPAGAHTRIGPSNPWEPTNREQHDISMRLLQDYMRERDADIRPYFQQPQQVPVQGQMNGSRPLDDEEENVRMAHELSMQFNIDTLLADEEVSQIMMNSHKNNARMEHPSHPVYAHKNPRTEEVGQNHNGSSGERVNAPVPVAPTAVADVDVEDLTTQLNNSSLNTSGNSFETPNENLNASASSTSSTTYSALSEESPRHEEQALNVSWSTVARRANNKPLPLTSDNTANKNMKNSEPKIKNEVKGSGGGGSDRKKRSDKPAGSGGAQVLRSRNQTDEENVYGRFACRNRDCAAEWGSTLALKNQPQKCMLCGTSTYAYKEDALKSPSELKKEKQEKQKKRRN